MSQCFWKLLFRAYIKSVPQLAFRLSCALLLPYSINVSCRLQVIPAAGWVAICWRPTLWLNLLMGHGKAEIYCLECHSWLHEMHFRMKACHSPVHLKILSILTLSLQPLNLFIPSNLVLQLLAATPWPHVVDRCLSSPLSTPIYYKPIYPHKRRRPNQTSNLPHKRSS